MKRKSIFLISALILAIVCSFITWIPLTATAETAPGSVELNRRAAGEGVVLLENSGILPLAAGAKVAMFGVHQIRFMRGGGGSGEVTTAYTRNMLQAMEAKATEGKIVLDAPLAAAYRANTSHTIVYATQTEATTVNGTSIANHAANAKSRGNDIAVVVYGRNSSEGGDRSTSAGGWLISSNETTMMNAIANNFDNIIVVLNVCSVTDLSWLDTYGSKIKAVVCPFLPGMEGADAVADVLCGDVNPSGKLVDTWPKSYSSWPSNGMFSTSNRVTYADDIYVGYRYFETVDPTYQQVRYPFGFGLSYTSFAVENKAVSVADDNITVTAKVTNTGTRAGKEVLQVYSEGPAGLLNKPARELRGFEKTALLQPGDSQILTISFPVGSLASYDDLGATGKKSAWVMEAGGYNLYLGNSVKNARENGILYTYNQVGLRVVDQLTEQLKPSVSFNRWVDPAASPKGTAPVGSFEPVALSATAPVLYKAKDIYSASNAIRLEFVPGTYERCTTYFNSGTDISYRLNAPVAGQYKIAFEYSNGNSAVTTNAINIFVDEVQQTGNTITFAKTGDGNFQQYYTFTWSGEYNITLPAGVSTLRLRSLATSGNLKNIRITPPGYVPPVEDVQVAAAVTSSVVADVPVEPFGIGDPGSIFPTEAYGVQLLDVYDGKITMKEFLAQLSMDDLYYLVQGHGGVSPGVNTGSVGRLYKYGIPGTDTADGPAGLRLSSINTTAWPTGTTLACSWNKALLREVGVAIGTEYDMHNVDYWLAPGMNIHRDPLCGRNFEYYSEDPLVTGEMALAATLGVQSKNVGVTLKHFYGNNREASRSSIDTIISERASREIYLKGFEIAVRGGNPWCLMTSYNLVNSQETAELYDLITKVLREEWGFKGFIVTDWGNDSAHFKEELAGNDVKMSSGNTANLTSAYNGGVLSREILEANVEHVLNVIMRTSKFKQVIENPDLLKSAEKPVVHSIGKTAVTDVKAAQFAGITGAVQTETTSDSYSPGLNVGYMDAGGSITYYLDVAQGGVYSMGFRYAANSSPYGQYTIQVANSLLANGQPNYRDAFNKPSWATTGDWQGWTNSTYYSLGFLPAGEHYLRINITGGGSNLNVLFFRLDTPYADIRFDGNGATGGYMLPATVVPGDPYIVPAPGYEFPYKFMGFRIIGGGALNGTIVQSGDTIASVPSNITLKAIWEFKFTDSEGKPIEHLTADSMLTELHYKNTSGVAVNMTMFIAVYAPDGKLKYLSSDAKSIGIGQSADFGAKVDMPDNIDGIFAEAGYYAKVFLWDNDFIPVMENIVFK